MSTWVLLRGLTRESRHWGDFVERMRAAFPGDRVLAPDLPGNGALNGRQSPLRVSGYSDHCRDELRRRGLAPPYRLLAMSLGAMVAIDWAARWPGEVDCAVLMNTSLRGFSPFYRRLRAGNYAAILRHTLSGRGSRQREEIVLRLTSRHPPMAEPLLLEWQTIRAQRPVSARNALRQMFAAARFRAPQAPPACPLLVLASEQDGLVDARCSRELARRWDCDIALHPTAGHDIPLDDGAWVVNAVRDWLSRR